MDAFEAQLEILLAKAAISVSAKPARVLLRHPEKPVVLGVVED